MTKTGKYLGTAIAAILILLCLLYMSGGIGVGKGVLERDARKSQKIEPTWQVAQSTSNQLAAMLFYPEDGADHTFSIYVNRPGLSFGYFFRGGGSLGVTESHIAAFSIEGYTERAFVSMNKQGICKVEVDDGSSIQTTELDSQKPFAFILPLSCGSIRFYDTEGTVVEPIAQKW